MRACCLASTALFLLSLPAFPWQSETPANPVHGDTDRRITLDVVVTNKSGAPVAGMAQQDFVVLDNKHPQKILDFRAINGNTADPPIQIILLIDRVNTSTQNAAYERLQTEKFLRQNGGHLAYPVSMVFLSDSGTQTQDASQDGNALAAALEQSESGLRTIRRSQGIYGVVDRIRLSLGALSSLAASEANTPGRKMLIWISPGWPPLAGPSLQLTDKQRQGIFNQIVATSTALWRAHITLYSIDPLGIADAGGFGTGYYQEFTKGVNTDKQAQAGNLTLQVLAYQSGGRVLNLGNDIAGEIATCIADANAFYVLSFDSPPADNPNGYHGLEVKIGKPGFKALTRTVYYAQP
ncbi:MAG: VWA domain-containing protein [Bryobacteraceae bacterium]|jgi:VWFA-related protein